MRFKRLIVLLISFSVFNIYGMDLGLPCEYCDQKTQENLVLTEQIKNLKQDFKNNKKVLKDDLSTTNANFNQLLQENTDYFNQINNLKGKNTVFEEEIENLKTEKSTLEQTIFELKQNNSTFQTTIDTLNEKINVLILNNHQPSQDLSDQKDLYSDENLEQNNEIVKLNKKIEELEKENLKLIEIVTKKYQKLSEENKKIIEQEKKEYHDNYEDISKQTSEKFINIINDNLIKFNQETIYSLHDELKEIDRDYKSENEKLIEEKKLLIKLLSTELTQARGNLVKIKKRYAEFTEFAICKESKYRKKINSLMKDIKNLKININNEKYNNEKQTEKLAQQTKKLNKKTNIITKQKEMLKLSKKHFEILICISNILVLCLLYTSYILYKNRAVITF